jgi:hypothetical protein
MTIETDYPRAEILSGKEIQFNNSSVLFHPQTVHPQALAFALDRASYRDRRGRSPNSFRVVSRVVPDPLPARLGKDGRKMVSVLDTQATNNAPLSGAIEPLLGYIGYPKSVVARHLERQIGVCVVVSSPELLRPMPGVWRLVFARAENDGLIRPGDGRTLEIIPKTPAHILTSWGGTEGMVRQSLEDKYGLNRRFLGNGAISNSTQPGRLAESELLAANFQMSDILPQSAVLVLPFQ